MSRIFILLAALLGVALPSITHAEQRLQYTYCSAGTSGNGQMGRDVYSAPFPDPPSKMAGETDEQSKERRGALYRQAEKEFRAFLETNGYPYSNNEQCHQIGAFLPSDSSSQVQAIEYARMRMENISKDNNRPNPIHVDFLPSWAKGVSDAQPPKPEVKSGSSILLSDGPTPSEMAQKRDQEAQAAARKQQEEIAHAQAVQRAFDAQQQAEAQAIRARAEAMRRDYDRRQAACRAGDRANCYSKVSEQ